MDNNNPGSALQMSMAERELGAFITAVTELYGSEQANISAEDWLDQLELMHELPELTSRDMRLITMSAAARLANRLIAIEQQRKHSWVGTDIAVGQG